MRTYRISLFTFNGMEVNLEEGLDLQGARNEIARILRVKRRAGMDVTKLRDLEYECVYPEYGVSDSEGLLQARREPPRYGSCAECGDDLEEDGRNTRYCPSCDTCEECGCFDGHNAGCGLADTEEIEG